MDRKQQGNIGESFAAYYYTSLGFIVSKPMVENTPYDLIVDTKVQLLRVQVKSSSYRRSNGKFAINLKTSGGNKSGSGKVKLIDSSEVDVVFALCSDGTFYEIPANKIEKTSSITVSDASEYFLGRTVTSTKLGS